MGLSMEWIHMKCGLASLLINWFLIFVRLPPPCAAPVPPRLLVALSHHQVVAMIKLLPKLLRYITIYTSIPLETVFHFIFSNSWTIVRSIWSGLWGIFLIINVKELQKINKPIMIATTIEDGAGFAQLQHRFTVFLAVKTRWIQKNLRCIRSAFALEGPNDSAM